MRRLNDWFTNLYQSRSSESAPTSRPDQPIVNQATASASAAVESPTSQSAINDEEMATGNDEKSESERKEDEIK